MPRWLHPEDADKEWALDDLFIVPTHLDRYDSRREVDLSPPDGLGGSHPLVVVNMRATTGRRMARTMPLKGGLAILDQDMDVARTCRLIAEVRAAPTWCDTALTVTPDTNLEVLKSIVFKRESQLIVVVDGDGRPLGVITVGDLKRASLGQTAGSIMNAQPVFITLGADPDRVVYERLLAQHITAAPVVDDAGVLVGTTCTQHLVHRQIMPPNVDAQGRLQVMAAVGINGDPGRRAGLLVEAGACAILIDTAHGDQRRMLDAIAAVRSNTPAGTPIVAGTVCTHQATERLVRAGATIIKANIGAGGQCTTRVVTGVGRPSASSTLAVAQAARDLGAQVWADAGVRRPGHAALYLALGASRVMVGTVWTGTWESASDLQWEGAWGAGRPYKQTWGMASGQAVQDRNVHNRDAFDVAIRRLYQEGVRGSQVYLHPDRASVGALNAYFVTGLESAFAYTNARTIPEFWDQVTLGSHTAAALAEGAPHGSRVG